MWVEITEDIFNSDEISNLTFLLKIIFACPRSSRNTKAKLFVQIEKILKSKLFERLDSIDRGLIEDSIKQFSYEDNPIIKFKISNNGDEICYKLEEAIILLNQPLWIVLENSINDSFFIKAIIHHFSDDEQYLIDCLNNGWIEFANAGGSGAKNQIKGKLLSYENISAIYNSDTIKYYRGFVILDSDNDFPGHGIKEGYNTLIEFLQSKKIPYHILEKRAMENYMPDDVILDIRQKRSTSNREEDINCVKWINVYEFLSETQKDFLNFEGHAPFTSLPVEAQNLYSNQLTANYDILMKGMSYKDTKPNLNPDERRYKNAFPKLFIEHPLVNKINLVNRCGNDELQRINNKIKDLL